MPSHILRVVQKDNCQQQHFFDVDESILPTLGAASVRIQSRLFGLSSANIAYCALGPVFGDWKCFPVPSSLETPNHDKEQYGVAPTWGYAEVLSSNIPKLPPGTMLWGFIPTSTCPVDLQLEQSDEVSATWSEVSDRRAKMSPIYNRYITVDQPFTSDNVMVSKFSVCVRSTWEAAYVLNRFCFAVPPIEPIHPTGTNSPWTIEDSSLKSTLIIAFGASSRTCRAFLHQLIVSRSPEQGPVGFIGVTNTTEPVFGGVEAHFPIRMMSYGEAQSASLEDLTKNLNFERILLLEFGGRDNIMTTTLPRLRQESPDKQINGIAVGAEMTVQTGKGFIELGRLESQLGIPIVSTGSVNAAAMKQIGEKRFLEEMEAEFSKVINAELQRSGANSKNAKVLGMQLNEKQGMRGEIGLEQVWKELFDGDVQGSMAIVVNLRM